MNDDIFENPLDEIDESVVEDGDYLISNEFKGLTESVAEILNWDKEFAPCYTPSEMLSMGIFGGLYLNSALSKYPESWATNAKLVKGNKQDSDLNYYGVLSGMTLDEWKEKGWIRDDDPRGWFEWYCNYFMGRRTEDDARQIGRWKSFVARHSAQIMNALDNGDVDGRLAQKQALLQWSWDYKIDYKNQTAKNKNLERITKLSMDDIVKYPEQSQLDPSLNECVTMYSNEGEVLNESFVDILTNPLKIIPVLFKDKILRPLSGSISKVNVNSLGEIEIQGINYTLLLQRIREYYNERGLTNIMEKQYQIYDMMMYEKKKIKKSQMSISYFKSHAFFALELMQMFEELYKHYNFPVYGKIADEIYRKTWLSKRDRVSVTATDVTKLYEVFNDDYYLLPHQLEFIKQYNSLKSELSLEGFMLSFKQGLGKTLTAVALGEVLNKDVIYIVCPNTVVDNWAYEIKKYLRRFNDNDELFKSEVYIVGNNKYRLTEKTKYIIVNNEAIPKVFPTIQTNKKSILIIDESHNFRNVDGKRVNELIALKTKLKCEDVLAMSGTPIKAAPSEIAPVLRLIDPLFTDDVAKIYAKCFAFDNVLAANIVKARFSKVIYQVSKSVLNLPPKYEHTLEWSCKDPERYLLENVRKQTKEVYDKIYRENIQLHLMAERTFRALVQKYSDSEDTDRYLKMCEGIVSGKLKLFQLHDLDKEFFFNFHKVNIIPNITNAKDLADFKAAKLNYVDYSKSCMGKAIGVILPKARTQMFIDIYEYNKKEFHNIIRTNTRKILIFSMMRGVVEHIHADLVKNDIGAVKIVGGDSKNRMDAIINFKENDDIQVIVATSQTLSTGITLTEANRVYFFGTPWRSTDYEQASDRVHRIGQTSIVDIFNIVLPLKKPNLSSRLKDILDWSSNMVGAMMTWDENDDDIIFNESVSDSFDYDDILYTKNYTRYGILSESIEPDSIDLSEDELSSATELFGNDLSKYIHKTLDGLYYGSNNNKRTELYSSLEDISLHELWLVSLD